MLPAMLVLVAAAWARCSDDWRWAPDVVATSGPTLPAGAAPWVVVLNADPRDLSLRDADGDRVPVRRRGEVRTRLVPWLPLRRGATYDVELHGQRLFGFTVGSERDTTAPAGGDVSSWSVEYRDSAEGGAEAWTLGVAALDEPSWFEADLWRGEGARVRVVDEVLAIGEGPLARDRFLASFSPETAEALGGVPDAAVRFAAGACSVRRLPGGEGPLTLRLRYLDAAGNTSAWSEPISLALQGREGSAKARGGRPSRGAMEPRAE